MNVSAVKASADLYLSLLAIPLDSMARHHANPLMAELRSRIADYLCVDDEAVQNAFELVALARGRE